MDSFESAGYWWLPSNPENNVYGTLKFTSEVGIELSLKGFFDENAEIDTQYLFIVGILENGKPVTLYKSSLARKNSPSSGFLSQHYVSKIGFVGYQFTEPNEMLFYKVAVNYSYLQDWAMLYPLMTEPIVDENKQIVGIKFKDYNKPSDIVAETKKGKISVRYAFSSKNKFTEFEFKQLVKIIIEPSNECSWKILKQQFIYPLQNLLTLTTWKPNFIVSCHVYCRKEDNEDNTKQALKVINKDIQVIFSQPRIQKHRQNVLYSHNMMFTVNDIKDDFGSTIEKWLNVHEKISSICNLFFNTKYVPLNSENEFLNLVQAVESYHRRQRKNKLLPEAEHDQRKKEILESIPDAYKEWVRGKLALSNEPSLHDRIKELVQENILVINPLMDFYKTPDEFVKKVKNTRNFFTHYNQRNEKNAAKGDELLWMTRTLDFLLQACFLSELGHSPEKRAKIIINKPQYKAAIEGIKKDLIIIDKN